MLKLRNRYEEGWHFGLWCGDNGRNISTRRKGKRRELNISRKIGLDIQKHRLLQNQKIHHLDSQRMFWENNNQGARRTIPNVWKRNVIWHSSTQVFQHFLFWVSHGLCWVGGHLKLWVGVFGNEAICLCMKKKCHLRLFHLGVSTFLVLSGSHGLCWVGGHLKLNGWAVWNEAICLCKVGKA